MAIADFFKKLLGKGGDASVIGIDIGTSSIKVVQLKKKKGKAVLETYGEIALGPYANLSVGQATSLPNPKIIEALLDVIKESNVTTPNSGFSIPFRSSLVTLIEMPALPEKQLAEMVPIEARKYIPVPITEVSLDYWVVPKAEGMPEEEHQTTQPNVNAFNNQNSVQDSAFKNKIDVLVVSIHNDVLNNFADIVNQSRLNTSFFEIEMFSSTRSLTTNEPYPVMIFDFGASGTKLYIVEHGVIKASHIINKGSQDITLSISKGLNISWDKAEQVKRNLASLKQEDQQAINEIISLTLDFVFEEASSILVSFQKKYNKAVGKVILTGGGVAQKGIYEMAKSAFQTDVEMGDPFSKIEAPAFLQNVLRLTGLEFNVAVGVALRKLQELG